MQSDWKQQLAQCIADVSGATLEQSQASLMAPSADVCDWCSNLAFSYAKESKTSPAKLAAQWAAGADWPDFIAKAQSVGPYLNFHFSAKFWSELVHDAATARDWASHPMLPSKVLVEFPSVNPNKPWHVGHLRNALLGDSLARLLTAAGHTIERMDYIDDLGLQVAQSVWGAEKLGKPSIPSGYRFAAKADHILGWQYVDVSRKLTDPVVEQEVRALILELEEGRSPRAQSARALVESCVRAQYETAFSFGIYHDVLVFESDIVRAIFAEGIEKIKKSGAVQLESDGKNAGCVVAKLAGEPGFEGMEHADKVLIRSDGTATYTGKDVAFQLWKFGLLSGDFHYSHFLLQPNSQYVYMSSEEGIPLPFARAKRVVNVIGAEQAYPQMVIAALLRKMGHVEQAGNCIHLSHALVVLPQGRFSGREGNWMASPKPGQKNDGKDESSSGQDANSQAPSSSPGFTADELLYEMVERAGEKIKEGYSQDERLRIANAVAVGAIRFWFLRTTATQQITFDYERALSFSGDSGPYVQYAYARACRILEKAAEAGIGMEAMGDGYTPNKSELELMRLLLAWPSAITSAAQKHQVHPIAEYCINAASRFSEFYTTTPVLADEIGGLRGQRLMLVAATKSMLGSAMDILGLPKLERM